MSPRPRRAWSKVIEFGGVHIRVYEIASGSRLYIEARRTDGTKDRRSLGHKDRAIAEQQARELARHVFDLRRAGGVADLTMSTMFALYELHQLPLLSPKRQDIVRRMFLPYFRQHFPTAFLVVDLGQSQIDGYLQARRKRAIKSSRHRGVATTPRDGTLRAELNWLKSVFGWARTYRIGGNRLLTSDPFDGLELVREKNPRRPIASEDRYQRTLAVADAVDVYGRLACMLALARFTGRRIGAICKLRAADILLTRDQILRGLAERGMDERQVDHMPNGAIAWPAETDKQGFEELTPISSAARAAIDRYFSWQLNAGGPRAGGARVGAAWLFPDLLHSGKSISIAAAGHLLRRAEEVAGLIKLERGLWHPYRRAWASDRKHLPDVDTAKAGGWRDLSTMKLSYQQPDPATMLKVVENAAPRLNADIPQDASGGGSTA